MMGFWISTVKLPDYYETMLFDRRIQKNNWKESECYRSHTESKAIEQHAAMVVLIQRLLTGEEI